MFKVKESEKVRLFNQQKRAVSENEPKMRIKNALTWRAPRCRRRKKYNINLTKSACFYEYNDREEIICHLQDLKSVSYANRLQKEDIDWFLETQKGKKRLSFAVKYFPVLVSESLRDFPDVKYSLKVNPAR